MTSDLCDMTRHLGSERIPEVFLRIVFSDYTAIGPYGAGFLETIDKAGSIGAAARAKGVTYRQAWLVTRNLNAIFHQPVIETRPGRGGGACLTPLGRHVVRLFRDAEREASIVLRRHTEAFRDLRSGHRKVRSHSARQTG